MAAMLLTVAFGAILSLPVMWLWNLCLVPAIPQFNQISWLQAWGILILINILAKNNSIFTSK